MAIEVSACLNNKKINDILLVKLKLQNVALQILHILNILKTKPKMNDRI